MKKWWSLIKEFIMFTKSKKNIDDDNIEMYVCSMCQTIYLNIQSYITHYKVDACTAPMYILPNDPLGMKEKI